MVLGRAASSGDCQKASERDGCKKGPAKGRFVGGAQPQETNEQGLPFPVLFSFPLLLPCFSLWFPTKTRLFRATLLSDTASFLAGLPRYFRIDAWQQGAVPGVTAGPAALVRGPLAVWQWQVGCLPPFPFAPAGTRAAGSFAADLGLPMASSTPRGKDANDFAPVHPDPAGALCPGCVVSHPVPGPCWQEQHGHSWRKKEKIPWPLGTTCPFPSALSLPLGLLLSLSFQGSSPPDPAQAMCCCPLFPGLPVSGPFLFPAAPGT